MWFFPRMPYFSIFFGSGLIRGERTMDFRNKRPPTNPEKQHSVSSFPWDLMYSDFHIGIPSSENSILELKLPTTLVSWTQYTFSWPQAVFIVLHPSRIFYPFSFPWLIHNHSISHRWGTIMSGLSLNSQVEWPPLIDSHGTLAISVCFNTYHIML